MCFVLSCQTADENKIPQITKPASAALEKNKGSCRVAIFSTQATGVGLMPPLRERMGVTGRERKVNTPSG
jgi:hypothetical protein